MKNLKDINCSNRKRKKFTCSKIENILLSSRYISLKLIKMTNITLGNIFIQKKGKLSINKYKTKIINNSFSIYFFKNVILNEYGSIYTTCNEYISIKGGCRCEKELKNYPDNHIKMIYNVLLIQITQYLGSAIYHSVINCLTKILPLLKILNNLSRYYIHIHKNKAIINYLHLLNIDDNKLVSGNVYSNYAIVMDRVGCTSTVYTSSVAELRNLLIKKINNEKECITKHMILFIRRLYARKIKHFDKIIFNICYVFKNYTCKIYEPHIPFNIMIEMFSDADIIISPHGAGLTNIIVSKKDVKIMELLRNDLPVLCYADLSYILGYNYYGIYSNYDVSKEQFDINITKIFNYLINLLSIFN